MRKTIILILILYFFYYVQCYSRDEIQKIYPGYGTDYILFEDEDPENPPILGFFNSSGSKFLEFAKYSVEKDVKFDFYSRDYPFGVPIQSKSDLPIFINKSKPIKCVTHGWLSSGKKDSTIQIKNGFLSRYDVNVLVMDWSEISGNPFYPVPMMATGDVGKYYGGYLNYLVDEMDVEPEDIHLVGHSLGAHVSGFAAREVRKGKIGRVTGLDPALPGFDLNLVKSGTLNQNDAEFVDVIHTCAGFLGYKTPLGHADFYPNGGGPPQPGCGILEFIETCSHGRSWKIFTNSLFNEDPYVARKCPSFTALDKCSKDCISCDGDEVPIGDPAPFSARGIFYINILREDMVYSLRNVESFNNENKI